MTTEKKPRKSRAKKETTLEAVWELAQRLSIGAKVDLIKELKEAVNIEVKTKKDAADQAESYLKSV